MRVFIAVLILILNLQSWTKADDIRDFEIEGMSIGDSLLSYMSEDQILSELIRNKDLYYYKTKKKFNEVYLYNEFKNYSYISFFLKPGDKKYIIQAIYGDVDIAQDILVCYQKQNEIADDLNNIFDDLRVDKGTYKLGADPSGKSKATFINWKFSNGDIIEVTCYDYDKSIQVGNLNHDGLDIAVNRSEVYKWLFEK